MVYWDSNDFGEMGDTTFITSGSDSGFGCVQTGLWNKIPTEVRFSTGWVWYNVSKTQQGQGRAGVTRVHAPSMLLMEIDKLELC